MSITQEPDDQERCIAARFAALPTREPLPRAQVFLRHAQQGGAQAFGKLYDVSIDTVFRYLYYGTGNESLAQMLTRTTYLNAKDRILEPSSEDTDPLIWLLGLAREALQQYLGEPYRLRISAKDVQDNPANPHLLEAINRLTAEQQECLTLRFVLQLGETDIATLTHRTLGETRILLVWAYNALINNSGPPGKE